MFFCTLSAKYLTWRILRLGKPLSFFWETIVKVPFNAPSFDKTTRKTAKTCFTLPALFLEVQKLVIFFDKDVNWTARFVPVTAFWIFFGHASFAKRSFASVAFLQNCRSLIISSNLAFLVRHLV